MMRAFLYDVWSTVAHYCGNICAAFAYAKFALFNHHDHNDIFLVKLLIFKLKRMHKEFKEFKYLDLSEPVAEMTQVINLLERFQTPLTGDDEKYKNIKGLGGRAVAYRLNQLEDIVVEVSLRKALKILGDSLGTWDI